MDKSSSLLKDAADNTSVSGNTARSAAMTDCRSHPDLRFQAFVSIPSVPIEVDVAAGTCVSSFIGRGIGERSFTSGLAEAGGLQRIIDCVLIASKSSDTGQCQNVYFSLDTLTPCSEVPTRPARWNWGIEAV
jgi:hypothetical protein